MTIMTQSPLPYMRIVPKQFACLDDDGIFTTSASTYCLSSFVPPSDNVVTAVHVWWERQAFIFRLVRGGCLHTYEILYLLVALEVDYLETLGIKISIALCARYLHCLGKFNEQFHGKGTATAARFEACLISEMFDEEQQDEEKLLFCLRDLGPDRKLVS